MAMLRKLDLTVSQFQNHLTCHSLTSVDISCGSKLFLTYTCTCSHFLELPIYGITLQMFTLHVRRR